MGAYTIKNLEHYIKEYKKSIRKPKKFWDQIARDNFVWYQEWDQVYNLDMQEARFQWFVNAKVNITKNCLDRHLAKKADHTALIFEPNDPQSEAEYISYQELYLRVCKMAHVLQEQGIQKGDRVCIYLPMIPELVVAMLACARIGAIHTVVFAGFSSKAVARRIQDCDCKLVITADGGYRGNKTIPLKSIVDEALTEWPDVQQV